MLDLSRQSLHVDADVADQAGRGRTVGTRAVYLERAAVNEPQAVRGAELVALGMATKVVVILQNENAWLPARASAKEMRRRKATDSAAHDDEIVCFPEIRTGLGDRTVAQSVNGFERSRVTAAQPRQGRRVV